MTHKDVLDIIDNAGKNRTPMEPKRGDRIVIKNVPEDYHYKDLYQGLGVIDTGFDDKVIHKNGTVSFLTGYVPYKDVYCSFSGCGYSVKFDKMKYIETKPAPYWKFKDGIRKAHNGVTYYETANYFEVDFVDIN